MKWLDRLKQVIKFHPDQTSPDLDEVTKQSDDSAISKLYPREREVFQHLLRGAMMKDIAAELNIKTSTVNGYCREIYRKLEVNSKAQLILKYSDYNK